MDNLLPDENLPEEICARRKSAVMLRADKEVTSKKRLLYPFARERVVSMSVHHQNACKVPVRKSMRRPAGPRQPGCI